MWASPASEMSRARNQPDCDRQPGACPLRRGRREALQAVGVWDAVEDRVIMGENVAQTFQYAESGNVDVAFVPLSLTNRRAGVVHPVPESLHGPIVQALGVVSASTHAREARAFADFVNSAPARAILEKYGYGLPAGN